MSAPTHVKRCNSTGTQSTCLQILFVLPGVLHGRDSEVRSSCHARTISIQGQRGKTAAEVRVSRLLGGYEADLSRRRTVSGAIHPLIQIGHGVEFGLDALVAEGLAQACVHSAQVEGLFPLGWPNHLSQSNSAFASAFSHFKSMKSPVAAFTSSKDSFTATISRLDPARPRHPRLGLSGFTVLGHMLKDPRLAAGQAMQKDDFPRLGSAIKNRGDLMRAWCEEWVIDPDGGWTEVCEKLEEIFWIATVLVGASSRPGYKPRMDFFMMHALTSAIFLPGMLEVLSPNSRISLLHSHFRVMVAYWVSRGRWGSVLCPQLHKC
ncbi:Hypothetical predicted protein [Olea europaea subsp. europaea]|uniref:Uncharacterized protein n=1 Tax=Olea europaea subsp. europaea TaxID=158383 RepID=A0A8S0VKI6_OLEEU|nr:Hypothetical predicted protein [Olea europaea subsp. europaea]